jgi:6-phosphofructokinase
MALFAIAIEDFNMMTSQGFLHLAAPYLARRISQTPTKGSKLGFEDVSQQAIANIKRLEIDCLVCIGGDGTLNIASRLFKDGVPIIGVPKTIDNDMRGTDITVGFDSAVSIATEAIDRIHTTAQSHHRVMIVEVMGRNAGWIALHAGVAGGGDVILIPEIPYEIDVVVDKVKDRNKRGKRFTIVVVAEGAKPKGGDIVIKKVVKESTDPVRLGGIGFVLASQIEGITGIETRAVVIGHLQRGGGPNHFDRILATRLGTRAVDMIEKEKYGYMVAVKGNVLTEVSLEKVAAGPRQIPLDDPLIQSARSLGTCFGNSL